MKVENCHKLLVNHWNNSPITGCLDRCHLVSLFPFFFFTITIWWLHNWVRNSEKIRRCLWETTAAVTLYANTWGCNEKKKVVFSYNIQSTIYRVQDFWTKYNVRPTSSHKVTYKVVLQIKYTFIHLVNVTSSWLLKTCGDPLISMGPLHYFKWVTYIFMIFGE